jgi:RES domain-containing protein
MITHLPELVFRVTRSDYAKTVGDALSGIGGLHDDGRWHSQGRRIVYTSESSTLCLLERLVHADEWIAERQSDRVMLRLIMPEVSCCTRP